MSVQNLSIVTNLGWPSFKNVALDIQKALKPYCNSIILDWKEAEPGGNILFVETVRKDTLEHLKRLLPSSKIVFYGTTEGHSILDGESIKLAKNVNMVAVSNFVKSMLEEVGISVVGVVHHGLDMDAKDVSMSFSQSVEEKIGKRLVALTVASNDPRKGLGELLKAHKIVEGKIHDSFLILHSEPKRYYDSNTQVYRERYYDLAELVSKLGIERIWLTNCYGLLTAEEVNSLYQLCHVYVLSSFAEGFGLPILEAFRFNKPVIAVDAPPFNEIIKDRRTGILIPCKGVRWFDHKNKVLFKMHMYESYSLAEAMSTLLSDNNLRKGIEDNIRKEKNRWSIHKLYPKLLQYF